MQRSNEYSVLWGLAVFAVIGALILVLKWAYSGRRDSLLSRPARPGAAHEYGLMVPLAAPRHAEEGAAISALLHEANIRAGVVGTKDGLRVMVWPEDLERARRVLLDRSPE